MANKNFDNNDPSFRPEAAVGTEETPGTPGASESRENKNLLSPRGRIGRWTFALVWITATILNTFLIELSNIFVEPNEAMILLAVIVAVGLVSVFAAIKRCRDAGIATAWAMLAFLPLFNFLLFFYLVWKPAKDAVRSEQSGRRETPTANRPARGARTDETVVNVWDCDWDRDSEAARRLPVPPASSVSASSLDERVRESGRLQGEWEAERANAFMDGIGARLKSLFPGLAGGGDCSGPEAALIGVYLLSYVIVAGFAINWAFDIAWGHVVAVLVAVTGLIWLIPFGGILAGCLVSWYLSEGCGWWVIFSFTYAFPLAVATLVGMLSRGAKGAVKSWPEARAELASLKRRWFGRR